MVYRQASTPCALCGVPLERIKQLGHTYLACPACRGKWVSPAVLGEMYSDMQWGAVPELSAAKHPLPGVSLERSRNCPQCGGEMSKAYLEQLLVDVCTAHGIWFDHTELQQALERTATGVVRQVRRPESSAPLLQQFFDGTLATKK